MRPIFTVHAGEYLVGSYIEKHFKNYNVWIPSKDTGVDLLITDKKNKKSIGLQVKFSKDYYSKESDTVINQGIKSRGWWTFKQAKIRTSKADYWVFVLHSFQLKTSDFLIVRPSKLLAMYKSLQRSGITINSYLSVTSANLCWETRGLHKRELREVASGGKADARRNWTKYLNRWPF